MRFGFWEIVLIVGIILLVFGTSRFGQVKDSCVKAVRNFRNSVKDVE